MFPFGQLVEDSYYKGNEERITLSESDAIIFHDAIKYVAHTAAEHLSIARQHQGKIPSSTAKSGVLLPMIPSIHYLSKLEDAKYNLFDPSLTDPNSKRLKLLWLLSRTWLTNVI
jgi:hypothetical protein